MNPDINISPGEWERIESYLQGTMPAAERPAFEEKLAADKDLQTKVQEVQLLILGVQEAALITKLNQFHQELPQKQPVVARIARQFPVRNWWAVASILFAIIFCVWMTFFFKDKRDKIYEAFYKADPGLMTTMGISDNYTFDRAMVDYKTGHYAEAIGAWIGLLKDSPQNDTLNYFIGMAFIADNNITGGMYLEKVIAIPGSKFVQDAYWYQGLTLLKAGKPIEMVARYIRQSNHPQKEQLLKELQQLNK